MQFYRLIEDIINTAVKATNRISLDVHWVSNFRNSNKMRTKLHARYAQKSVGIKHGMRNGIAEADSANADKMRIAQMGNEGLKFEFEKKICFELAVNIYRTALNVSKIAPIK